MPRRLAKRSALGVFLLSGAAQALPAFPGAEGFGAETSGGRGGAVIKVTTLAPSGPGSFQEALDAAGPRIIVFDVSGVIDGDISLTHGDVTIAGQTAPGAGVTISGQFFLYGDYSEGADNVIIRHLRVRPPEFPGGDGAQYDAIQGGENTTFVVLDHVSVCCGLDETVDLYTTTDSTVSWSTIEEAATEGHPEGVHNYGLINGPDGVRFSVHHTLFVSNQNRNPAIANGPAEVRSNVVYNVRHAFIHHNPAQGEFNIVGNHFKQGPENTLIPFYFDDEDTSDPQPSYFLSDNYVDDPGELEAVVENPWQEHTTYFEDLATDESHRAAAAFDFSAIEGYLPITTLASSAVQDLVLVRAGAFPRDSITTRVVQETRDRQGSWGAKLPADLLEGLSPGTPPLDSDGDGMPDSWETDQGLDPMDGTDHTSLRPSGYTAIEDYINGLADTLVGGGSGSGGTGGSAGASAGSGGTASSSGGASGSSSGGNVNGGGQGPASGGMAPLGGASAGAASPSDDGGCGCRVASDAPRPAPWLAAVFAILGLAARKIRRRR